MFMRLNAFLCTVSLMMFVNQYRPQNERLDNRNTASCLGCQNMTFMFAVALIEIRDFQPSPNGKMGTVSQFQFCLWLKRNHLRCR